MFRVVVIASDGTCDTRLIPAICYSSSEFHEDAVIRIEKGLTKMNAQPLFLIKGRLSKKSLRDIITHIRKYNKKSFIISQSQPILQGLGHNVIFILGSNNEKNVVLYSTCSYSNNHGSDEVVKTNFRSISNKFRTEVFLKQFSGNIQ